MQKLLNPSICVIPCDLCEAGYKNLDPSDKMDLNIRDCFGRAKLVL